jgi:hypothetical protein
MPATIDLPNNEATILTRVIAPERGGLSLTAARSILKIKFPQADHDRMRELSRKANAGTLTAMEQDELNDYERVGLLIDLLHSKARKTLKKRTNGR